MVASVVVPGEGASDTSKKRKTCIHEAQVCKVAGEQAQRKVRASSQLHTRLAAVVLYVLLPS